MKWLYVLVILYSLSLTGCFGAFQKVTVEIEPVTKLLEGQKLEGSELVLREGQSIAIEVTVLRAGNEKTWGSKESSQNPTVADVHMTTEKNVYVVTAHRPGTAELQFKIHDRRWYTLRRETLSVKVLERGPWTPLEPPAAGGAGGGGGGAESLPPAQGGMNGLASDKE